MCLHSILRWLSPSFLVLWKKFPVISSAAAVLLGATSSTFEVDRPMYLYSSTRTAVNGIRGIISKLLETFCLSKKEAQPPLQMAGSVVHSEGEVLNLEST